VLVVILFRLGKMTVFARVCRACSTFQRSGKEASAFFDRACPSEGLLILFLLSPGYFLAKFADLFVVETNEFPVHVVLVLNINDLFLDVDLPLLLAYQFLGPWKQALLPFEKKLRSAIPVLLVVEAVMCVFGEELPGPDLLAAVVHAPRLSIKYAE